MRTRVHGGHVVGGIQSWYHAMRCMVMGYQEWEPRDDQLKHRSSLGEGQSDAGHMHSNFSHPEQFSAAMGPLIND